MTDSSEAEDWTWVGITIGRITYKRGWQLRWQGLEGEPLIRLWWNYECPDSDTGEIEWGSSGEAIIRPRNREQLVRTAWSLVLACEEHEAREFFIYNGLKVMDPHKSITGENAYNLPTRGE